MPNYSRLKQDTELLPQSSINQPQYAQFHGTNIAEVMQFMKKLLNLKRLAGQKLDLNKQEMQAILDYVYTKESPLIHDGVNFSRIQIDKILEQQAAGNPIDFETLGPYLASYNQFGGTMTLKNLLPEDAIGLQLAVTFRKLFPQARLVSLYDDYNHKITHKTSSQTNYVTFTKTAKKKFVSSLIKLLTTYKAIPQDAVHVKDYLLICESEKVRDAEILIEKLEATGHIERKGDEIFFINEDAENQLYRKIQLKTKSGRWLCEALDAAAFLKPENLYITHIVVLPNYMKSQQDKVWEMLKILGIKPEKYHNIFYDETYSPADIATTVEKEFKRFQQKLLQNN